MKIALAAIIVFVAGLSLTFAASGSGNGGDDEQLDFTPNPDGYNFPYRREAIDPDTWKYGYPIQDFKGGIMIVPTPNVSVPVINKALMM